MLDLYAKLCGSIIIVKASNENYFVKAEEYMVFLVDSNECICSLIDLIL